MLAANLRQQSPDQHPGQAPHCTLVIIDCLTLFVANLLHAASEGESFDEALIETKIAALCEALCTAPCDVVLVSNEVGSGVVPAYASGRRFRDVLGELNQRVAPQWPTRCPAHRRTGRCR